MSISCKIKILKNIIMNEKNLRQKIYKLALEMYKFEQDTDLYIKKEYPGEFNYIIYSNLFNTEIANVQRNITNDTTFNKFAQTYNDIFVKYSQTSFDLTRILGQESTLELLDSINKNIRIGSC